MADKDGAREAVERKFRNTTQVSQTPEEDKQDKKDQSKDESPELEEALVKAEELKVEANVLFSSGQFESALSMYKQCLALCPEQFGPQRAKYWGNVSACQFKLQRYEETVEAAKHSIDLDGSNVKVRMRRAAANDKLDTWASLEECVADLDTVSKDPAVPEAIKREATRQLVRVKPRLQKMQKQQTDEALGKLKELGNGLLGHFGLSLDNFQMNPNGDGQGYSVNFNNK